MFQQHYSNPATLVPVDVQTLSAAKKSIDYAAYSLTQDELINALVERAAAGVAVRVYLDRSELEAEARGNPTLQTTPLHLLLGVPNITMKVKASMILMHLKSYCVDGALLRDGSANFSPEGEFEQDNSLTLTDDPTAIAAFGGKFAAMWARPDNLSPAIAIETSPNRARTAAGRH